MRADLRLELAATSPEEAQELLLALCRSLASGGLINAYGFEISAADGVVTERCVLSRGTVVA